MGSSQVGVEDERAGVTSIGDCQDADGWRALITHVIRLCRRCSPSWLYDPARETAKFGNHSSCQSDDGDGSVRQFCLPKVQRLGLQTRPSHSARAGCHRVPFCTRLVAKRYSWASGTSTSALSACTVLVWRADGMGGASLRIGPTHYATEVSSSRPSWILGIENSSLRSPRS